jgi:ATP-binding cassette subfamily B protein
VIAGDLSPGELTAFLLYTLMVTGSLMSLAQIWSNLARAAGASTRIFELLDEEPAIRDAPDAISHPVASGTFAFDQVSFSYPTRPEVEVLTGISFEVRAGETVALVGKSGAGKSTIAALLHRFYTPTSGRVTLDGVDIAGLKIVDLRAALATVHQEPMLFSGSVGENMRYGRPEATDREVREAAGNAGILDFVEGLPEGFETEVGERGVRLSGGQRQRIAIARAMLADPRILVLDEATSHLDTVNEGHIQASLGRLMIDRTTLVIAHRLSTVRSADRILVVDGGRIVEQGRHDELLSQRGVYQDLIRSQELAA